MPSVKSTLLSAALSLAALAVAAGAAVPAPASTPAPRIVSTVPAATLNLVLIGAADRLVGVSKYDLLYLPQNKRDLPVVGDYETMNYEQLVKLHPSALVIQTAESRHPRPAPGSHRQRTHRSGQSPLRQRQ